MNPDITPLARANILRKLRGAMPEQALPTPDLQAYYNGPWGSGGAGVDLSPASLQDRFVAAAQGWRAEVLRSAQPDLASTLQTALHLYRCQRIAVSTRALCLPAMSGSLQGCEVVCIEQNTGPWKHTLFNTIDASITLASAGLADTGSLVVLPGPDEPRTLSLVPPIHIALLRASTLHASLPAAMRSLRPEADMPTNLLLITGPSKTADIQQTLAYGAHGPKQLVIVLIDDLAQPLAEQA